ncbi:MAG: L-histidine N(alpha)-methyltransferase [Gammaproteobacteria bacterium]|jgi:dimethylhistidine N-methyltransferase|nr:L-histidine N(alpha)-methyltransferase [Gammaproteobacteria bacterium]
MRISQALSVTLHDYHPRGDAMREEVLEGLRESQKTLPCKYFYDEQGSRLFDAICELPEYYLTRTELGIMETHVAEMAAALGSQVLLVEPGSGSSLKTRMLLDHLQKPVAYVPVDISREHLVDAADRLNRLYPDLEVLPVCADFNQAFEVPAPRRSPRQSAVYFPGSTLGNFGPTDAVHLLDHMRRLAGLGGALLLGVDLRKDKDVLQRAYDDAAGVTAAFNLNILERINRELDGGFDLTRFHHRAVYNEAEGCIEMHLVSVGRQVVPVAGESFGFHDGEHILSERSYKYSLEGLTALALRAGLMLEQQWLDDRRYFCVAHLRPRHA